MSVGIVGGAIGAAIGSAFGAAGLGFEWGSFGANVLFGQRKRQVGKWEDLRVTGAGYGGSIPLLFGTHEVGCDYLWSSDLVQHTASGGKGASSVIYSYTFSAAIQVCDVPPGFTFTYNKIWANNFLIYDAGQTPHTNQNITLYTGTQTQGADPYLVATLGTTSAYRGTAYFVIQDFSASKFGQSKTIQWRVEGSMSPSATSGNVFSACMQLAGYTTGEIDVTQGTDVVNGYVVDSRQTVGEIWKSLAAAYPLSLAEVDHKVTIVRWGSTPVATITWDDLGTFEIGSGAADEPRLKRTRKQASDIPASIDVTAYNLLQRWQGYTTHHLKSTAGNNQVATLNLPFAFTPTDMSRIGLRDLWRQEYERVSYEITVPWKYMALTEGDVISVATSATATSLFRILSCEKKLGSVIKFTIVPHRIQIATQTITGDSGTGTTPSIVGSETYTAYAFANNAIWDDDTDSPGFYVAATGNTANWNGVDVWAQLSAGSTYTKIDYLNKRSVIGVANTALGGFSETAVWDNTNTVDVTVVYGTLTTANKGDILAQTNIVGQSLNQAMIGKEYILYSTATLIGANQYRLSGLIRGYRGTDVYMNSHSAGETFVQLSSNLYRQKMPINAAGSTVSVKLVPGGADPSGYSPVSVNVAGWELYPWSVIDVAGSRDGSGNLTITWNRRDRNEQNFRLSGGISNSDTPESYSIEVWDSTYTTLKRTLTASAPTVAYSSANQVTDFGVNQATVYLKIYQISPVIGRGYVKNATV